MELARLLPLPMWGSNWHEKDTFGSASHSDLGFGGDRSGRNGFLGLAGCGGWQGNAASMDTVAGEYILVPVMQENGGCGVSSAERIREGKLP